MGRREDGFTAYYRARAASMRRTAYLLCGDWHGAEDLVQTAYTKLYLAWHRVSAHDRLDQYVRRIVVRAFLDDRRRGSRREYPTDAVPEVAVDASAPEERMVLVAALARVASRQRAVLVLRFWEDLSVAETADLLGITEGTVKSHTARGLETLRRALPERHSIGAGDPA
jgi:RNA polymerase sigma-70 factor (sigma-E family)